ncbi:hypothetical protein BDV36DRAFT_264290 [Aspergillus pseudocaelatus]|uniref:Uncharacterized protein n=1 Tax=Aspergillus pseudocaelatus TaxID=1825620 RepID=A0ABQ6WF73_9EURO|nr:hypothetical protein BDV36DRAFT_264290 [Aspergillus pseudocaelatus]
MVISRGSVSNTTNRERSKLLSVFYPDIFFKYLLVVRELTLRVVICYCCFFFFLFRQYFRCEKSSPEYI